MITKDEVKTLLHQYEFEFQWFFFESTGRVESFCECISEYYKDVNVFESRLRHMSELSKASCWIRSHMKWFPLAFFVNNASASGWLHREHMMITNEDYREFMLKYDSI